MTMIEMTPTMITKLQTALTALEVYRMTEAYQMTDDVDMIKLARSALGELAEMIKQALHDAQAAAVGEAARAAVAVA